MGVLDFFKRQMPEASFMFDLELIQDKQKRIYLKQLALQTCINMIARTISQSEFRVKNGKETIRDETYYRLNLKPNLNMTAQEFWQTVIYKLIYDNEVLVIQSDTDDLLIADDFQRTEYALYTDKFSNVVVKDYEFKRVFDRDDVLYWQLNNEDVTALVDSLFDDYGSLFAAVLSGQKRKNQIRSSLDIDVATRKGDNGAAELQAYVDRVRKTLESNDVAVMPNQKGVVYTEHSKGNMAGQTVDEINKVTDGFLEHIARALGIPINLIRGDLANIEEQTRNYMTFCIDPFIKKIKDELDARMFTQQEYLAGRSIEVRRVKYSNIFDVASAVDKLRSAGVVNGNELREELGLEPGDDPLLEEYFITKNYQETEEALKGGDDD